MRTSAQVEDKVIYLALRNISYAEIVRRILAEDGISVSRITVRRIAKRFIDGDSFKHISGRPSVFNHEHLEFINIQMEGNDQLTTSELQESFHEEFNFNPSESTIARARRNLGWIKSGPRYCQLVSEKNCVKRLEFATNCVKNKDTFENVIFTDESSIWLNCYNAVCFRKLGQEGRYKPRAKHPFKVHVWAGISMRGATNIFIFTGIMDASFYVGKILKEQLLPFLVRKFPENDYRFQQDNNPKHTSKLAKEFMTANNINWWCTPASSPDMNPIEMVWHELKYHLRKRVKPRNKDELVKGIKQFWSSAVTIESCTRYINHMHKVIPRVIEVNGHASGF